MDRIKTLFDWIVKRLFPISIVIFVLIYLWWFRLTPWNFHYEPDPSGGLRGRLFDSNFNYLFGLILLTFYVVSGTFWWLTKNRNCLGMFFHITTIFFFILSSWYTAVFMPRLIDVAKYNGTVYYLISYSNWPEHTPWDWYRLTKWHGLFNYEISDYLDDWAWKGKFFYDKKTNLVNIEAVFDDRSALLYTDDNPPRYYEHSYERLGNNLYYISSQCISKNYDTCNTYKFTLYECEIDNSGCAMLPFRYTGEEQDAYLEINEGINNELDFYVYPIRKPDILVYSYGEYPRCYVEGCEILKNTK